MKHVFNETTLLPISLVVTICSGVYMFARLAMATEVNRRDVDELSLSLKESQAEIVESLKEQSERLAEIREQSVRIDAKLDALAEQYLKKQKR